jgi:hypothetical protein
MKTWEKIIEVYPELKPTDDFLKLGIYIKDDGDGIDYIQKWEYSEPLPDGFVIGKPSSKK